jgi:hypothetical protein
MRLLCWPLHPYRPTPKNKCLLVLWLLLAFALIRLSRERTDVWVASPSAPHDILHAARDALEALLRRSRCSLFLGDIAMQSVHQIRDAIYLEVFGGVMSVTGLAGFCGTRGAAGTGVLTVDLWDVIDVGRAGSSSRTRILPQTLPLAWRPSTGRTLTGCL